jgi:hypothetical protein
MPILHDSTEGTTHSHGDGCGDPAHNPWWLNMIPAKIKRPTYSYASGGGNRDICWVDGQNNFRKKMIEVIPSIIAEAERRKTEEIRAKILDFQDTMEITSSKVSSEYRDGIKVAINIILGKL